VIDRIYSFIFYLYESLICSVRNTVDKQLSHCYVCSLLCCS